MRPLLECDGGRARGVLEGGLAVFRRLPFAAPPVGSLRFAAPAPPLPWSGVRDAGRFGPAPPQRVDAVSETLGLLRDPATDEDCLHLNVWTPGLDDGRRPVLVWIPGGAFVGGSSISPVFDGGRLAADGDVVLVTLQYRVGAPGFLDLPSAPGNRGLLDQIAALRFVRSHAERLGGDPDAVTVFGESAGAGSITALLAMPEARGLFQRAIVQSAAPEGVIDPEEASRRRAALLAALGVDEASERLHEIPIDAWLEAQQKCSGGNWKHGMFFLPVVDGRSLPETPLHAVERGAAREVELIVGTNREEMRLFGLGGAFDWINEELLEKVLEAQLERPVGPLVAAYREALPSAGPVELFFAIQTDFSLRRPSIRLAEAQARHQPGVYMYRFDWRSPFRGAALGACHALDLPFVFGSLEAPGMAEFAGAGPAAEALGERMRAAWTSFARSGEPRVPDLDTWPRYETDRRATLVLDEECRVVEHPWERERVLWDDFLRDRSSDAPSSARDRS